jgi:hypothetical protein
MKVTKRRLGYLIWGVAFAVIAIPELLAAAGAGLGFLHFKTISETTGHLERYHPWVELVVVAAIVFFAYSYFRTSPHADDRPNLGRTPGGRLTKREHGGDDARERFDADEPSLIFLVAAAVVLAGVAFATWAAVEWWDDERHFHPSFVLYGLLFLFWLVMPSLVVFFSGHGREVPFPTLYRTVRNLEEWLEQLRLPWNLGPLLAWFATYVILAGLVILLIHLTLYPYPDITHIINPKG